MPWLTPTPLLRTATSTLRPSVMMMRRVLPWLLPLASFLGPAVVLVWLAPSVPVFEIREHCYRGVPWMVWGAFLSDLVTALVYQVGVPAVVLAAVHRGGGLAAGQGVLPLRNLALWCAFIWCCGLEHLAEALETWVDVAPQVVVLKAITAAVSAAAVWDTSRKLTLFSTLWALLCDTARRVKARAT